MSNVVGYDDCYFIDKWDELSGFPKTCVLNGRVRPQSTHFKPLGWDCAVVEWNGLGTTEKRIF